MPITIQLYLPITDIGFKTILLRMTFTSNSRLKTVTLKPKLYIFFCTVVFFDILAKILVKHIYLDF